MRIQNNFHINGCALCLAKWLIRCILILHIYGRFFVRNKINCKNSSFSFLSRVCSRSYHLRDDRQIFCHEFLRRYICVLCRVVPYSGEVREFLQLPPRPRPQGLLVFQNEKILETRCFSKHSNTCPKFISSRWREKFEICNA